MIPGALVRVPDGEALVVGLQPILVVVLSAVLGFRTAILFGITVPSGLRSEGFAIVSDSSAFLFINPIISSRCEEDVLPEKVSLLELGLMLFIT